MNRAPMAAVSRTDVEAEHDMTDLPAAPDYAEEINREYAQLRAAVEATVSSAILLGQMLIAQKKRTRHGGFMPWVKDHCAFSHESANIYMRIAADPNSQRATNLSLREFLDKPKPTKDASAAVPHEVQASVSVGERKSKPPKKSAIPSFVPLATSPDELLYCSFCAKSQNEVQKLIAGPSAKCGCCGKSISAAVYVCDECIGLCYGIIRDQSPTHRAPKPPGKAEPTRGSKGKNP